MKTLCPFVKIFLFLTSYIPLGIVFLIIDFNKFEKPYLENFFKTPIVSISLIASILILLVLTYIFLRSFEHSTEKENYKIVSVENLDNEVLSYIFTYMLPFISFPQDKTIPIVIFMAIIIGAIYTTTSMIGINPTLIFFGYHIMKIEFSKDGGSKTKIGYMLTKEKYTELKYHEKIITVQVHEDIFLIKEIIKDE